MDRVTNKQEWTDASWIMTVTGRVVDFENPQPDQIELEDIAHGLSMTCRFSGHVRQFYSVAEHSVRVSQWCDPAHALWGLMHDAAEAYLTDIPRPMKKYLPVYREWEEGLLQTIADRFGLAWPMPTEIHETDMRLLATEARDLCASEWRWRELEARPLPTSIYPLPQQVAKVWFMQRFDELAERAA